MNRSLGWLVLVPTCAFSFGCSAAVTSEADEEANIAIVEDALTGTAPLASNTSFYVPPPNEGAVKQAAGWAIGDAKLESDGRADKIEGKIQNAIGGLKDTLKGT